MLTLRSPLVITIAVCAAWPVVADAQVTSRPPRGFRGIFESRQPVDPNRARQDLTFTLNATGGIDDNLGAGDTLGPPIPGSTLNDGATSQFDLGLDYQRGTSARSFSLSSWGSFQNYYGAVTLADSQSYGFGIHGRTEAGRRHGIGGGARMSYSSQLPLDQPLNVGEPDPVPPPAGLNGLYESGNWLVSLDGNADRRWSRRDTTRVNYTFSTTEFIEGRDGDLRSHQLQAQYSHQTGRSNSLDMNYEFIDSRIGISDNDPGQPRLEHRVHGGFTYSKRLSTTRTVDISAHGGAMYIDAVSGATQSDYQLWTPFAQASMRVNVWRQWAVDAAYERSSQSIPGFQRPETYITDTISASFGGLIGDRTDLIFSGAFATGDVGIQEARSEYNTRGVSAQVRVRIVRTLAAVAGYHYYRYEYTDTILPIGLPPVFDRNAFRVGLSFSFPIIGGYTDGR